MANKRLSNTIRYSARIERRSRKTKRTIKRFLDRIEIKLPSGEITTIDLKDEWIIKTFPSWVRRKNHVAVGRRVATEFGYAWEEYYVQRLIVKCPANRFVDHIDRNPFNNRRSNLRIATRNQNCANSGKRCRSNTGFFGVHKAKRRLTKPFVLVGRINRNGKRTNKTMGYYESAYDAACAYDEYAKKEYGEFARLNFPKK